jgi:hypothetical protein
VVLDMEFSGLRRVVHRMLMMSMCQVGVMAGRFMIAGLVVFGCAAMMSGRMLVMGGCFAMVLCCLFGHGFLPEIDGNVRGNPTESSVRHGKRTMNAHGKAVSERGHSSWKDARRRGPGRFG